MVSEIALATDFAIILVTAAVVGFVAKQTGQPTIVAYILTGLIVGPVGLGIITEEAGIVELMAELGLGFLLFLLGIKMRFEDIGDILRPILSISVGQTILQTALDLLDRGALYVNVPDMLASERLVEHIEALARDEYSREELRQRHLDELDELEGTAYHTVADETAALR